MFNNIYANTSKISIERLVLQETGTFNQMFHRPYEAVLSNDGLSHLSRRIEETIHQNSVGKVTPSLLSGLSDGLITVSATPDQASNIVNGWGERRFRFTLTVSCKTGFGEEISYFQGYSEYFDISHGNNVNPEMIFFINSYTRVSRKADPTNPMGGYIDRVMESRQVLNGTYAANGAGQLYGQRPEDLFVGVQSNFLSQGDLGLIPMNDTRVGLINKTFGTTRQNAVPSSIISNLVNTWRETQTLADFGQGDNNLYDRAISQVHERSPMENTFIATLSNIQNNGISPSAWFTLNDLARIDPTVSQRTFFSPLEAGTMVHNAGTTANWNGAGKETQIAYLIANATSGLMQACGLATVHFFATNMTMGQGYSVEMTEPGLTYSTANPMAAYQLFTTRFANEVMADITEGNLIPVSITVSSDIYNETSILISIDGGMSTPYSFPTFADSLLQSTMTVNESAYRGMVGRLEDIMNYCGIDSMGLHQDQIALI